MLTLLLGEAHDRVESGLAGDLPIMSMKESEGALMVALRTDCFRAIGIDHATSNRKEILPIEWIDFTHQSDLRRDYYATAMTSRVEYRRFDDVQVRLGSITTLWQVPRPREKQHLPQVLAPEGTGFMPLYCAALWIATRGGTLDFDAGDVNVWRPAFSELLERISAGDVRENGVADGAREAIAGRLCRMPGRSPAARTVRTLCGAMPTTSNRIPI